MRMSKELTHVHFIGIGGIGMSGLARLYLHEGVGVSGSDSTISAITQALEQEGVEFFADQGAHNITNGIDLVVYTEAMPEDHPEVVAAREQGIETINYFEALGRVANEYYLIAVAGTHGKTTTTAMLIDILEEASFDPTAIVGSLRSKTGSNFRAGKSKYFIVEACEYKRDFLTLEPDVLVITNLEHEHVDYYRDLADVQAAFKALARKVPEDGVVIAQIKDASMAPVLDGLTAPVLDYQEAIDLSLELPQPGLHNQLNAAAARKAAEYLDVEKSHIDAALKHFAGTKRRFEFKGEVNNAPVFDDYAHHPTEIEATIAGVRAKYPDTNVIAVFQPHTFSRLKELEANFITALSKADRVLMIPVYAAREADDGSISSEMIIEELKNQGVAAEHFHTHAAAAQAIKESATKDDVVVVMGAGDVTKVSEYLTNGI